MSILKFNSLPLSLGFRSLSVISDYLHTKLLITSKTCSSGETLPRLVQLLERRPKKLFGVTPSRYRPGFLRQVREKSLFQRSGFARRGKGLLRARNPHRTHPESDQIDRWRRIRLEEAQQQRFFDVFVFVAHFGTRMLVSLLTNANRSQRDSQSIQSLYTRPQLLSTIFFLTNNKQSN